MNFLEGGERHSRSASWRSIPRTPDAHTASPGDSLATTRPGDVRGFVHKRIFGGIKGVVGGFLGGGPLGAISGGLSGIFGGGSKAVPQVTQCPPGFFFNGVNCQPQQVLAPLQPLPGIPLGKQGIPGRIFPTPAPPVGRERPLTLPAGPVGVTGEAVLGQFGAGFEPEVFDTMVRRCPRRAVLGADGICYNRGDLRNSDRFWPRGRRPLLTGGDMRAISTASSAAKKLQRKQKQLQQLGLLPKPSTRSRRALPPGHRAELRHASSHD